MYQQRPQETKGPRKPDQQLNDLNETLQRLAREKATNANRNSKNTAHLKQKKLKQPDFRNEQSMLGNNMPLYFSTEQQSNSILETRALQNKSEIQS